MEKIRQLYIKAVATLDFAECYNKKWKKRIKKTIEKSSKIFKKKFGIELVSGQIEIGNIDESKFYECEETKLLKHIKRKIQAKNCDLIVIFLCDISATNNAFTDSKRYIILYNQILNNSAIDLVHELGHCFGVKKHSKDFRSIMAEFNPLSKRVYFDEQSKKRILKNKWKKFR